MIQGIDAIDSTLFTTVGFCHKPFTAGKGGLIRGFPRLPSRDSIKAVSSPQIYAPPPQCTCRSKSYPEPLMFLPNHPAAYASLMARSKVLNTHMYSPRMYMYDKLAPNAKDDAIIPSINKCGMYSIK